MATLTPFKVEEIKPHHPNLAWDKLDSFSDWAIFLINPSISPNFKIEEFDLILGEIHSTYITFTVVASRSKMGRLIQTAIELYNESY